MGKKLVGVSFGKTMGNTEILLREALMGAEAAGAEVALVRAYDYDIKPCNGCNSCTFKPLDDNGFPFCRHNDDFKAFMEHILDADGVIFASPVYQMTPTGYMRLICDRIGPHFDVAVIQHEMKIKGKDEYPVDERIFKRRVAGFLCVGGAERFKYVNMALPLMNLLTYPNQIEVVDQHLVMESILTGHVLAHPEDLERANQLGRNVAESMDIPTEDLKWYGKEGLCPVCHNNMMVMDPESDEATCGICGVVGKVRIQDGKTVIDFPKDRLNESRLTMEEKELHGREITDFIMRAFPFVQNEVPKKIGKYKNYDVPVLTPEK